MKKLHFTIPILLFTFISNAQVTFQKALGGIGYDIGTSVKPTSDGGYIIAGWTNSFGAGNYDMYLIKTDANGDTVWTKTFGSPQNDMANSVEQTSDGGYILCGKTNIYNQFGDLYLVKTNALGDLQWARAVRGGGNEWGNSVQQTNDGGYIITGLSNSFTTSNDVYLVKTDSLGNTEWIKTYGSSEAEEGWCVRQTMDGGFIIAADGGSNLTSYGAYIIKTDFYGNTQWTRKFDGADDEQRYYIEQTADSGYIISGSMLNWNYDLFIAKTDANGNIIWKKALGGSSSDYGYCVKQTSDGGYITCGMAYSFGPVSYSLYLVKTDTGGITQWSKTYGNATFGIAYSVEQTADGGYILSGYTDYGGAGAWDVYLIKTDAYGNSGCNEQSDTTISDGVSTSYSIPAITVSTGGADSIPATIQGSGANVFTLCTTAGIIEKTADNPFYIAPNPASGNFTITFQEFITKGQVQVFNAYGVNVFSANLSLTSDQSIHIENIANGFYTVKVFDGEKSYCRKLLVMHD